MRQTQTDGHGTRRIEADVKPRHHPAEHIDGHRDPGPANRTAVQIIYEHQIDQRVVDLHHGK